MSIILFQINIYLFIYLLNLFIIPASNLELARENFFGHIQKLCRRWTWSCGKRF